MRGIAGKLLLLAGCLVATSCREMPTEAKATGQSETSKIPEELKSWDEFRFGMSYDEVLRLQTGIEWDAESYLECPDEIPVRGCMLPADPKRSYRDAFAGMMLLPTLYFNEEGQLTDLDMGRIFETDVTGKQCELIHARLVDELTRRFGAGKRDGNQGGIALPTPKGNTYGRVKDYDQVMVAGREIFTPARDGSEIVLLTSWSAKSKYSRATCRPSFLIRGPKALKHADISAILDARIDRAADAIEKAYDEDVSEEPSQPIGEPMDDIGDGVESL